MAESRFLSTVLALTWRFNRSAFSGSTSGAFALVSTGDELSIGYSIPDTSAAPPAPDVSKPEEVSLAAPPAVEFSAAGAVDAPEALPSCVVSILSVASICFQFLT